MPLWMSISDKIKKLETEREKERERERLTDGERQRERGTKTGAQSFERLC